MKTTERERLYEKIKEYALENFEIELRDEDLDEYETDRLIKIKNKLDEVVKYGDERWVVSYSKYTLIDFLESIFRYDNDSNFYDYSNYTVEEIVENDLCNLVHDCVIEHILECLDVEKYAEDYMYLEKAEHGYITTW